MSAQVPAPVVLVHQPGKVASQTIEAVIRAACPEAKTERHHYLSDAGLAFLDAICRLPGCEAAHSDSVHHQIAAARAVRHLLQEVDTQPVWVVTGVRNPLDLCISAFFQNLPVYCGWLTYEEARLDDEAARLIEFFTAQFVRLVDQRPPETFQQGMLHLKLRGPAAWIDEEINGVYGVDLYSAAADKTAPCVSFSQGRCNFLVYRAEQFAAALPMVLTALGLSSPQPIERLNVGEAKRSGRLYVRFRERFVPSAAMLQYYEGSRFFREFYGLR